MGMDRWWESRHIEQDCFWPARMLLVRAEAYIAKQKGDAEGHKLLQEIRDLLKRSEQR